MSSTTDTGVPRGAPILQLSVALEHEHGGSSRGVLNPPQKLFFVTNFIPSGPTPSYRTCRRETRQTKDRYDAFAFSTFLQ